MKYFKKLDQLPIVWVLTSIVWLFGVALVIWFVALVLHYRRLSLGLVSLKMSWLVGICVFFSLLATAYSFDPKTKTSKCACIISRLTTVALVVVITGYVLFNQIHIG